MKIILFFLFTICATTVCSQDYLLEKYESTYFYHRKEYTLEELGDVYLEYEKSLYLFNSGRANLNYAKDLVRFGGATIALGLGVLAIFRNAQGGTHGGIVLASGVLVELSALIYFEKGKQKIRIARTEFNFEMLKKYGYNADISIALGGTRDGIGISVQF